jgi:hypothetical protein
MATRRKYKDGGVVHDDRSADVAPPAVEVRPAASPVDDDPVRRGLAEIQRAEELARQHAYADHAAKVDQFAGLSDWKRSYLKANPVLTLGHIAPIAQKVYRDALAAGMADDSEELGNFVLEKTSEALRRQREMREKMPAPDHEHRKRLADELEREAAAMDAPAPQSASKQAPIPSQRSMPVSAPVSRSMPSMTSGAMPTRITLSPEQIQIARTAYSAPDMTDAQKEKAYAMNLLKMERMRRAGTLNE